MLKPVASPVSDCGTAAKMRFGIAANARPMPIEFVMFHRIIAPWVEWSSAIPSRLPAEISAPAASGSLAP